MREDGHAENEPCGNISRDLRETEHELGLPAGYLTDVVEGRRLATAELVLLLARRPTPQRTLSSSDADTWPDTLERWLVRPLLFARAWGATYLASLTRQNMRGAWPHRVGPATFLAGSVGMTLFGLALVSGWHGWDVMKLVERAGSNPQNQFSVGCMLLVPAAFVGGAWIQARFLPRLPTSWWFPRQGVTILAFGAFVLIGVLSGQLNWELGDAILVGAGVPLACIAIVAAVLPRAEHEALEPDAVVYGIGVACPLSAAFLMLPSVSTLSTWAGMLVVRDWLVTYLPNLITISLFAAVTVAYWAIPIIVFNVCLAGVAAGVQAHRERAEWQLPGVTGLLSGVVAMGIVLLLLPSQREYDGHLGIGSNGITFHDCQTNEIWQVEFASPMPELADIDTALAPFKDKAVVDVAFSAVLGQRKRWEPGTLRIDAVVLVEGDCRMSDNE